MRSRPRALVRCETVWQATVACPRKSVNGKKAKAKAKEDHKAKPTLRKCGISVKLARHLRTWAGIFRERDLFAMQKLLLFFFALSLLAGGSAANLVHDTHNLITALPDSYFATFADPISGSVRALSNQPLPKGSPFEGLQGGVERRAKVQGDFLFVLLTFVATASSAKVTESV